MPSHGFRGKACLFRRTAFRGAIQPLLREPVCLFRDLAVAGHIGRHLLHVARLGRATITEEALSPRAVCARRTATGTGQIFLQEGMAAHRMHVTTASPATLSTPGRSTRRGWAPGQPKAWNGPLTNSD